MTEVDMKTQTISTRSRQIINIITLLFLSVFVITICSKSSPLYPLNDWDDPNCFFTVGKAMAEGKILYRDIFEQKGPLLYMLHELTCFISRRTFLGVYFVEITACFLFLYFSYKTLTLFSKGKSILVMAPLAALAFTSLSFCSGDSAEELCMPFLSYALYVSLKSIKSNRSLPLANALLCGIGLGAVLWIKFTMLSFYIGICSAFVIIYIMQKKYLRILTSALAIIAGMLIASIPVIWYFAGNGAFSELYEVYIYDNMFLYSTGSQLPPVIRQIVNLFSGLLSFAMYNTFGFICLIFGYILVYRKEDRNMKIAFTAITASAFFFSFIGGRAYAYYSYIMTVFTPVGMAFIYDLAIKAAEKKKRGKAVLKAGACVFSLLVTLFMCRNTYLIFTPKEELPQFRFEKHISQKENATLLNYGFLDGGFYTVTGIVPDCRYFCELNIEIPEMYAEQNDYAENGRVDFIVTKDEKPEFEKYELIDECGARYWNDISMYYLYRKK